MGYVGTLECMFAAALEFVPDNSSIHSIPGDKAASTKGGGSWDMSCVFILYRDQLRLDEDESMSFGALLILLPLIALIYGLYQFIRAQTKTRDAVQTTAYIVLYPIVVYLLWRTGPVPAWVAAPVVMAGLPWIVAGIHLNEIVKDPAIAKDNEFVGFPYGFWIWGGVLAVIVGLIMG